MTSDDESTHPSAGDSGPLSPAANIDDQGQPDPPGRAQNDLAAPALGTSPPRWGRAGSSSVGPRSDDSLRRGRDGDPSPTGPDDPEAGPDRPNESDDPDDHWYDDHWAESGDFETVGDDYIYEIEDEASPRKRVSRRGYIVGAIVVLTGMIVSAFILRSMVETVDGWSDAVPIKAGSTVEMDLDAGDHDIMVMIPHTSGFDIVLSKDVEGSHLARPYKWGRSIDVVVTAADGTELTVEPNLDIASFANDTYRFLTVGTLDVPDSGRYTVALSQPELVAPIPVPEGLGLVKLDIQSLLTKLVIVVLLLPLTTAAGLLIMLITYIRRCRQLRASSGQPSRFSSIFRPQNVAWAPTGRAADDPALDAPALHAPALHDPALHDPSGGDPAGDDPALHDPAGDDLATDSTPPDEALAPNRPTD